MCVKRHVLAAPKCVSTCQTMLMCHIHVAFISQFMHAGDAWQLKDGDGQVMTAVKPSHFRQPTTLPQRERRSISSWMSKRGFALHGTQAAYLLKTVWVAINDQQDGSSQQLPPFASIGNKRGTVAVGLLLYSLYVLSLPCTLCKEPIIIIQSARRLCLT